MRRLALLLAAAALGLGLAPAPAQADEGRAGDNYAVAVNTKDGSSLFRFAFAISRVAGEVVDSTNAAVAYSSCDGCRTTAIAIQIVFVMGDAHTVTPENVAVAVNYECTLCQTFAAAYQFVITTSGPVRFTAAGSREVAAIQREIRALRNEQLEPAELKARLEPLIARLRRVLEQELVRVGRPEDAGPPEETSDETAEEPVDPARPPTIGTGEEEPPTETVPTETAPTTTTTPTTTTGPTQRETTPTETAPPPTTTTP